MSGGDHDIGKRPLELRADGATPQPESTAHEHAVDDGHRATDVPQSPAAEGTESVSNVEPGDAPDLADDVEAAARAFADRLAARRKIRRRLLQGAAAVAVLLLLTLAWLWRDLRRFADAPLPIASEQVLLVEPGDGFRRVLARLRELNIEIGYDLYWQWLARDMQVASRLQAGEFMLTPGSSPRGLLQQLADGKVIQYRFTVIEGWTFRELRLALAADPVLVQTLPGMSERTIMRRLDAAGVAAEGRFLPETYHFARGYQDFDLLRAAHQAMRDALDELWPGRAPGLPLASQDEALVLASIIEKETAVPSERPAIAGVFTRRLNIGMLLQTDPTVIYGLGAKFDGNLTRAHLQNDTPWNTYTRPGLPPTPIALPGRDALHAALHPDTGAALYFVARGDGSHEFSNSLAEHNAAVRRFQSSRNQLK